MATESTDRFDYSVEPSDPDASVVRLSGEFDYHTARFLLPTSVDGDPKVIVFDLADIDFIDVGGIRRLLEVREDLHRKGKQVEFRRTPEVVTMLAEILGVDLVSLHGGGSPTRRDGGP